MNKYEKRALMSKMGKKKKKASQTQREPTREL